MDTVILEGVNYRYPETEKYVLKNINLSIPQGQFVCVIGANGSGKTTLCNAIRGFVPHFYGGRLDGSVTVVGKQIADHEIGELAGDIGYVFQNPFTQMSGVANNVFDELAYGLGNIGISPTEIVNRVERIITQAGLSELRDRDPMALSGGQMQRVALASVLVMEQPVLILDEPTSQLDPQSTDHVFDLVEAARADNRTIILVEHKMEQVAAYADRVLLMDHGEIILDGTPENVFTNSLCEKAGTRLPESIYLHRELEKSGIHIPGNPLTISDLLAALKEATYATTKEV